MLDGPAPSSQALFHCQDAPAACANCAGPGADWGDVLLGDIRLIPVRDVQSARVTSPGSANALSVSRRHWLRVASNATTPEEQARAAERLCCDLDAGLSRWIGVGGYRSLQDRALREVSVAHPALALLSFDDNGLRGAVNAVREHGAEEVAEGMVALAACLIELLGRIIGAEMALRLVEHSGYRAHSEPEASTTEVLRND